MTRHHRFSRWLAILLMVSLALPLSPALADTPVPNTNSGNPLFFKETGHTLAYNFRAFWEKNGGLAIYGYPITEVFVENGYPTQYFERARLEWHGDTNLVQGGLLGRWALPATPDQPGFQQINPPDNQELLYFYDTGHSVGGGFKDFWQKRGGLPVFGYPLTEEFKEVNRQDGKEYTVQYFERARFEYHPDLPVQFQVELGQLGRHYLEKFPASKEAVTPVKDAAAAWVGLLPTRVQVPRIKVDVDVTEGAFNFNAWDVPRYSAVHYWPVSGFPGSKGNIILAAHASFKDYLFYDLPRVNLEDEITLTVGGQEKYYRVIEILTVKPQESWVMSPSDTELLTLISCVPYGIYSDRLIVRAIPLINKATK